MARPTVAKPEDIRTAVLSLLTQAGLGQAPSAQSFRRAVSVRKVREQLGGGNPATIGRAINTLEAQLVQSGLERLSLPELPTDIAELMQQLWRAAVGVQLDSITQLRQQAEAVADAARSQLTESELRVEVLKQELAELRTALAERDSRLAQALTDATAQAQQITRLSTDLEAAQRRSDELAASLSTEKSNQAGAIAAAQERYEGLSRRLFTETAEQRLAAQNEATRLASQLKFAEKRQSSLETRLQQLESELAESRGKAQQSQGEVSALRYVNTSLQGQLEQFVRTLPTGAGRKIQGAAQASRGALASVRHRVASKKSKRSP
jgi:chromosome segregation ATPase